MRGPACLLILVLALGVPPLVRAIQLDALDLSQPWRLRALRLQGNRAVRGRTIRSALVTKPRPWFTVWREFPEFDPVAFQTDLERVARVYRNRGYFEALVVHDLELPAEGVAVVAVIWIEEGPPVHVGSVDVEFTGTAPTPEDHARLLATLPIAAGHVFAQEAYDAGLANLRGWYREQGFARALVTKQAHVDVAAHTARVVYRVDSGPPSVFGRVEISGTQGVSPEVVRRELAFAPGEPFRQSKLDRTRDQLSALHLFSAIRVEEEEGRDPEVDHHVHVTELPPREIRFGIGYDTEEQVRGLASWRHYNFLGGARQLGFAARASFLSRTLLADFLQPHFPIHSMRSRLLFAETQDDEDAYTLVRSRAGPRLEWQPTPRFTAYLFHRAEYDELSDVRRRVETRVPGIADDGVLSGLGLGADWVGTDDPIDPTRGFVLKASIEPVGGFLGGDIDFVRLVGEGRVYHRLVGRLLGSARLRLGVADPTHGSDEIPLFERFYAGGLNSVRGYGRWRVGRDGLQRERTFIRDEPIGGRTLIESAVELRHPVTDDIAAVVFLDAGQVDRDSYDFPVDALQLGTGIGARVHTPIGPLGVDLAFPLDPRHDDQRWQVHVSLGAGF